MYTFQNSEVIHRLVYDSISLASHILRRNLGSHKIKRNSELTSNLVPNDKSRSSIKEINSQTSLQRKTTRETRYKRRKRSQGKFGIPKSDVEKPTTLFLLRNSAERERLYFELKDFNASSKHRQIEEQLEFLITEQLEANRLHADKTSVGKRRYLPSENTTLRHPTWFGALNGDGFVLASGIRRFDFLLLDWKPRENCLVPVLATHDSFYDFTKVGKSNIISLSFFNCVRLIIILI